MGSTECGSKSLTMKSLSALCEPPVGKPTPIFLRCRQSLLVGTLGAAWPPPGGSTQMTF